MGISGVSNQPDSHSILLWSRLCKTSTPPPPLQKCCEQGHQMFKIDTCENFPKLMFYTWPSWKEVIHESLSFHIFIVITDSKFWQLQAFFFPFLQQRHSISLWCIERGDRNTEIGRKEEEGTDDVFVIPDLRAYWSLWTSDRIASGESCVAEFRLYQQGITLALIPTAR